MSDEYAEQIVALLASISESLRILVDAVEAERNEICNHIQIDSEGRCNGCNALIVEVHGS